MSDAVIAAATVVNTVILGAAAVYARGQVKASRESAETQTRPFVVVDLDFDKEPPLMYLTIENVGRTVASDVLLSFDPPLRSSFDKEGTAAVRDLALLSRPIATLPPGKKYEVLLDVGHQRAGADLDDEYQATIFYDGNPPGAKKPKRYKSTYVLDIGLLWGLEYTVRRGTKDIYEQLKKLTDEARKWAATSGGLLVKSPADTRADHRRSRAAQEERRARQQQETANAETNVVDPLFNNTMRDSD